MKVVNEIFKIINESVQDSIKKNFAKDVEFEKTDPKHCVSSIGFSESKQKWVGFSHRAMMEFGIGDMLFDQDFKPDNISEEELEKMPFIERGSIKIKTLEQAKKAASNFARYVS